MSFFSNRAVNHLNAYIALLNLLDQSYAIFLPIYFYKQGFSVAAIFVIIGLANLLRIPLRLLAFPLVNRLGLKTCTVIGAIGYSLSYIALIQVHGLNGWLALYIFIFAQFNSLHWICYHTWYSLAGDHAHRGKQVAGAQALTTALNLIGPIAGALIIDEADFAHYFALVLPLLAIMLLALSRCRNIPVLIGSWREGRKTMLNIGARIHLVQAASFYPLNFCWIFIVYFYVGKLTSLGGVITIGIIAQIFYQLLLGAWMDKGRGTLVANLAGILRIAQTLGKAFLPLSLPVIMGLEALSASGETHHGASQPMVMYNAGQQSAHPFWYWLFAETAFDLGTGLGAGAAALLLWQGMELRQVILVALVPMVILWWLVHGYFKEQPHG